MPIWAQIPDLTAGGVPDRDLTVNLGATGMRGWVYDGGRGVRSTDSRQILVTDVDPGSPADGIVAVDDVILGVEGSGAAPAAFGYDARKSLADEIGEAEARSPATLQVLRWRNGVVDTVGITLRTMGAYSATAPFNCPKSTKILEEGLAYVYNHEDAGLYRFGAMSLLASGNPSYMDKVQAEARALVPSASVLTTMMTQKDDTAMITWQRGYTLVFLTEYYLRTGDAFVLPTIEATAVNIAKNQSWFGTAGHKYADWTAAGENGPMGGVYGAVNLPMLTCLIGLVLAEECGVNRAEVTAAIERSERYFAYYANKGQIPYGEHVAYDLAPASNGKTGLAALAFTLSGRRTNVAQHFAKMATGAATDRENGHTGAFFNYLWTPLGANCAGDAAASSHFSRIRWHLELSRRWDGSFVYDNVNGEGPSGSTYHNFQMSTAALLTYALPLRQLRVTGKSHDPSQWLSSAEVADAAYSDTYDQAAQSTDELINDLASDAVKTRRYASEELASRGVSAAQLSQITALALDPNGSSRVGACKALGEIADASSIPTLVSLLDDSAGQVRFSAAEALGQMDSEDVMPHLDTLLELAVSTSKPSFPVDEADPLHFAHGRLAMLLFNTKNWAGPRGLIATNIDGVDRDKLYPAIDAISKNPVGFIRGTLAYTFERLNYADTVALAGSIVDTVQVRAPADKMFSDQVRYGGLQALLNHGFAEGIPLAKIYIENDGRGVQRRKTLSTILEAYAGACLNVTPDPGIVPFLQSLSDDEAVSALEAILNDPNPATLPALKRIQSIASSSDGSIRLPNTSADLDVHAVDFAQGESVYTWRKIHGAGEVGFSQNGNELAQQPTLLFQPVAGTYTFEVTMSDARGLTEETALYSFTLTNPDGLLPVNKPPTADSSQISIVRGSSVPLAIPASDPEGYALQVWIAQPPTTGRLSGTSPHYFYHADFFQTGTELIGFDVMDSEGQTVTAQIEINITTGDAPKLAIYEPFDYPAGGLNGQGGTTEIGLSGQWQANSTTLVIADDLALDGVPTRGGSIGHLSRSVNRFGGTRSLTPDALAAQGLLDDGATLWFSFMAGFGRTADGTAANTTNASLGFALANRGFGTGNFQYWIQDEGNQPGSGIGIRFGSGSAQRGGVSAAHYRDETSSMLLGSDLGDVPYGPDQFGLIVGKIEWGSSVDTIELYKPDAALSLGSPISRLVTSVDQATFDTLTFARGDTVVFDEIRFGNSYRSVLFGVRDEHANDYQAWAALYPGSDLLNAGQDLNGNGRSNDEERIWGLHPAATSVVHPTVAHRDQSISYTRRDPSLTGRTFSVWTSEDLVNWVEQTDAVQTAGPIDASGMQQVQVQLNPAVTQSPRVAVQVRAELD